MLVKQVQDLSCLLSAVNPNINLRVFAKIDSPAYVITVKPKFDKYSHTWIIPIDNNLDKTLKIAVEDIFVKALNGDFDGVHSE